MTIKVTMYDVEGQIANKGELRVHDAGVCRPGMFLTHYGRVYEILDRPILVSPSSEEIFVTVRSKMDIFLNQSLDATYLKLATGRNP